MKLRSCFSVAGTVLCATAALSASAATLCVNTGASGCYSRISDAVAAASSGDVIRVGPGVYPEGITISKPLSLVGDGAVVDAAGQRRGFFVDGMDAPGLTAVRISGFTVRHADMEGILVLNASNVTLSGNTVTDNDRSLTPAGCPNLPAYEPGEAMDCGEGIHIQAVDHSVVTQNTVQANAGGGILVSDDTGATHHNLLSFNNVSDNAAACGISLASHTPTSTTLPTGVYSNTAYANRVLRNGRSGAGGAGIGLFAAIGGEATYGNVIVDNLLQENGHPGVSMHGHAPGGVLNDNVVLGNTIVNNGADTNDAHTPGPTGINIYAPTGSSGILLSGNLIQNESFDIGVSMPGTVKVQYNNLFGGGIGLQNFGAGTVDATENFWSCGTGPDASGGCSPALGGNVLTAPWLTTPVPSSPNY